MQQSPPGDSQFVVDLLTTLRQERFSPRGWWRFLLRSWEMSRATAQANPQLRRSWRRVTMLMGVLAGGILIATWIDEGSYAALRLLPAFAFCVAWQQSDLFWHLGLNRQTQSGALLQRVGVANTLTELRGLGAGWLIGRLLGGLATSTSLALSIYIVGIISDICDGQVARWTGTQSKLGQILDGETDFCLYLAITLVLLQNGILPLSLAIIMLLRFCIPFLAALVSYFLFAHPLRFGSTLWGKAAGAVQCLYFFVLLAPPWLHGLAQTINLPLLVILLALLIGAPLAQIVAQRSHNTASRSRTKYRR